MGSHKESLSRMFEENYLLGMKASISYIYKGVMKGLTFTEAIDVVEKTIVRSEEELAGDL